MQVDFYYAIDSRYSYLAATQVPALEREFGCTIGWKPLSFQALMDARGDDPYDGRKLVGQYEPGYRDKDVHRWADFYEVPLVAPDWQGDWQRIALAATASLRFEAGQAMSFALFQAVMQDGTTPKSDADIAVIAERAGIDGEKLVAALDQPETQALFDKHLADARKIGVFGVPTFAVGTEIFWGNDRLLLLKHHLKSRVLL
ncbi:MAG TPA: DsbA family protein [Terriglobales bacterium]|nr:DsbA family protein [Terriglobales bacterium]